MTYVHITVDTEFSSCGYFNLPPMGKPVAEQAVHCMVDGRSHGLGFLLSTFAEHGVRATFFVEVLHTLYFGEEPMGSIARTIHAAGHDLQIHLHPCWLACAPPGSRARPLRPAMDHCGRLEEATAHTAIRQALEVFARWGLPRPIAFRAGNLQASLGTYAALAANGIPVASNVGLGVYRPDQPDLALSSGRHLLHGVVEVPVTSYQIAWPGGRWQTKALSITGTSFAEVHQVLRQAQALGLEDVVVLTHPFEFVKRGDHQYRRLARNRVNQRRLASLCRLIGTPSSGYSSATFRDRMPSWLQAGAQAQVSITMPLAYAALRMGENLLNDRIWAF